MDLCFPKFGLVRSCPLRTRADNTLPLKNGPGKFLIIGRGLSNIAAKSTPEVGKVGYRLSLIY